MDAITCNSCNRKVVPRLWHYRLWTDRLLANRFFNVEYMKTQHICPLCGVIMFETGGWNDPARQDRVRLRGVYVGLVGPLKHGGIPFSRQSHARCLMHGAGVQAGAG